MIIHDKFKYVFRALLGILFLFSATAKLIGIDAFEIYLFSFGWFSLGTAFLLARLVIVAEYILGLLLLTNFYPRLAFWGSLAMLAGFSLFLTVLAVKGNHDNCNCFGELVNLNPVQSLLKNLGMLVKTHSEALRKIYASFPEGRDYDYLAYVEKLNPLLEKITRASFPTPSWKATTSCASTASSASSARCRRRKS